MAWLGCGLASILWILGLFLEYGADKDQARSDDGTTPLLVACSQAICLELMGWRGL